MQELIDSKNLHHAYFLVGGDNTKQYLVSFLEKELKIKTSGNPDFWQGKFHNFSIEDARTVSSLQERKSFSLSKQIFIISADFISTEAQNSLLKVFEEPTAGTHFFIISPQNNLLPTLASRMQVVHLESREEEVKFESILSLSLKKRLEKVKEIVDEISDEEKTKQDAINMVNEVEREIHQGGVKENVLKLKACDLARRSLFDRGAPVKMILENLMLSI
ncbi:MAG TPA: hypothetical protein VGC58_00175 [Candidatus Paceibacterota bacterium]